MFPHLAESHEPPLPRLPTNVWKGARRTARRKGGVAIWHPVDCAYLAVSISNRTPPHRKTILSLWGLCRWQLALRVRCSHTPPCQSTQARWNGFVAVSNLAMNCLAMVLATRRPIMVLATRRPMTSPTTIPALLHSGFAALVICPTQSAARIFSGMLAWRKTEQLR